MPVPAGVGLNYMGLLTVNLPAGIHKGQEFEVLIKQLTSAGRGFQEVRAGDVATAGQRGRFTWRRVSGVFRMRIPVSTKAALLPGEERTLSIMRWIGKSIPVESRWFRVFEIYLGQLAERVKQMGGNPVRVLPSPTGEWRHGGKGGGGREGDDGAHRYEHDTTVSSARARWWA